MTSIAHAAAQPAVRVAARGVTSTTVSTEGGASEASESLELARLLTAITDRGRGGGGGGGEDGRVLLRDLGLGGEYWIPNYSTSNATGNSNNINNSISVAPQSPRDIFDVEAQQQQQQQQRPISPPIAPAAIVVQGVGGGGGGPGPEAIVSAAAAAPASLFLRPADRTRLIAVTAPTTRSNNRSSRSNNSGEVMFAIYRAPPPGADIDLTLGSSSATVQETQTPVSIVGYIFGRR